MQFKIATVVAAMPFIGTALGGCYHNGMKWTDIGNSVDIFNALNYVCDIVGDIVYPNGGEMSQCVRVNNHAFIFTWYVNFLPNNQQSVYISHYECVDIGNQAIEMCVHGGENLDIHSGPFQDGGQAVEVTVRADPQQYSDCS